LETSQPSGDPRQNPGDGVWRERSSIALFERIFGSKLFNHPLLLKYTRLVHEDLAATYSRDIQKWLLVAPIIGVGTGLVITLSTCSSWT